MLRTTFHMLPSNKYSLRFNCFCSNVAALMFLSSFHGYYSNTIVRIFLPNVQKKLPQKLLRQFGKFISLLLLSLLLPASSYDDS